MLTETVRIKQNRAENAKPSQFSRVFLEVPGGLRRDKEILQAVTWGMCAPRRRCPNFGLKMLSEAGHLARKLGREAFAGAITQSDPLALGATPPRRVLFTQKVVKLLGALTVLERVCPKTSQITAPGRPGMAPRGQTPAGADHRSGS